MKRGNVNFVEPGEGVPVSRDMLDASVRGNVCEGPGGILEGNVKDRDNRVPACGYVKVIVDRGGGHVEGNEEEPDGTPGRVTWLPKMTPFTHRRERRKKISEFAIVIMYTGVFVVFVSLKALGNDIFEVGEFMYGAPV